METEIPGPPARAATDDADFYVESGCCLLCGVPEDIAPEIFETGEEHCFIKRQPCSQDEVDRTVKAMWSSEVDCIRYRGHDTALLERLARAGMADQADHPMRLPAWTEEELLALVEFRRRNGHRWKSKLLDLYLFGKDDREPNGSALRHIRNRQGPSRVDGLRKATLDDAEARLAPAARTGE